MMQLIPVMSVCVLFAVLAPALAADVSGKWTESSTALSGDKATSTNSRSMVRLSPELRLSASAVPLRLRKAKSAVTTSPSSNW